MKYRILFHINKFSSALPPVKISVALNTSLYWKNKFFFFYCMPSNNIRCFVVLVLLSFFYFNDIFPTNYCYEYMYNQIAYHVYVCNSPLLHSNIRWTSQSPGRSVCISSYKNLNAICKIPGIHMSVENDRTHSKVAQNIHLRDLIWHSVNQSANTGAMWVCVFHFLGYTMLFLRMA